MNDRKNNDNDSLLENVEDDPPPPVTALKLRKSFAMAGIGKRLNINGKIEDSNQHRNLKDPSNRDLADDEKINQGVNYINLESKEAKLLISLLNTENIREKTKIQDDKELNRLSTACGQVFFQLMKNKLLKTPEDYSKTLDLLLQYDAYFLEKVTTGLAPHDLRNGNLDDVLSGTFKAVRAVFSDKIHEMDELLLNDLMNVVLDYSIPIPSSTHRNRLFTINTDKQPESVSFEPRSPKSR